MFNNTLLPLGSYDKTLKALYGIMNLPEGLGFTSTTSTDTYAELLGP